ncbi:MAG: hypothetical protein JXB49_34975 [Bacteroidales bacterium]|nr:hypothetical protein [Bacteroidales bacterium]
MNELKIKGGARVGWINSSYAELIVSENKLELQTFISNYSFQPSDIVSIEPYNFKVFIGQAVKITHKENSNKKTIIFYSNTRSPLFAQIQETGFLNNHHRSEQNFDRVLLENQAKSRFPIKKGFVIGVILSWSLLLMTDIISFFLSNSGGFPFDKGFFAAFGLLFLISVLSLISVDFRRLILIDGRTELKDIKLLVIFTMIFSGFMLLTLGIIARLFN